MKKEKELKAQSKEYALKAFRKAQTGTPSFPYLCHRDLEAAFMAGAGIGYRLALHDNVKKGGA
jgi:hypothetical protein